MSNSQNMTLEERLVQHIKETGLGVLITDEDAITDLTRRAIREALLQPTRRGTGYHQTTHDSPVVAAAREIAEGAVKKLVDAEIERIKNDPETMKAIREAMLVALPSILNTATQNLFNMAAHNGASEAILRLKNANVISPGAPVV